LCDYVWKKARTVDNLDGYSEVLSKQDFIAKISLLGEYEGFTRGSVEEIIRVVDEKISSPECYYLRVSLRSPSGWDDYEIISCNGVIYMVTARIGENLFKGVNGYKELIEIPKKQYIRAVLESTKFDKALLERIKPLKKTPTMPRIEERGEKTIEQPTGETVKLMKPKLIREVIPTIVQHESYIKNLQEYIRLLTDIDAVM